MLSIDSKTDVKPRLTGMIYLQDELNHLDDKNDVTRGNNNAPKFNDLVISGSTDCTARSWSFETGRTIKVRNFIFYNLIGNRIHLLFY